MHNQQKSWNIFLRVKDYTILSIKQQGFWPKLSCETQLAKRMANTSELDTEWNSLWKGK